MARAAISLIALAAAAQALPRQSPSLKRDGASFTSQGCFVDNANNQRLLSGASYADDGMTVESCAAFCTKFKYFGVEYGRECYCDNSLSATATADSDCAMPCAGDADETCGNGNRLNVYLNNNYVAPKVATLSVPYLGCFVDQGARVLPDDLLGADNMTAQVCAAHCADYSYFGVEYGRECWCGNSPPTTTAAESDCSMVCAGDDTQICGAGNRINVWGSPLASPDTVGDYEYVGCFTDSNDNRSLRGLVTYDPAMTLEKCAAACSLYSYFGVEYGTQCYCGASLEPSAQQVPQAQCSLRCGGDYNNVCGDADRLNVFLTSECKDEPANVPSVDGFSYKSCWTDDVNNRSLADNVLRSDDMTVEKCAAFCQGSSYFGVEYGRECYCGNVLGGASASEDECSEVCFGNGAEWCGAPSRLNVYSAVLRR
ncbi:uncharacterized protein THITE_2112326 [Thermothielavioides terrestris NRRL 8126]|uniref:WSC domain-containing protein n=1 Tax=Thermothielavioides terrestris (strain ATCC 38088 / NRRL 8126) TaxID=578455 RepID=G2QYK5_THETT|nr:uncharacterized protein THITE_2112326 [Thermothielavioides terrestris NRRL 8126]AEO65393.1 hypothetical protein THITE_2112326 [Thermothielavioides terrestris NRRL 8126]